jgi:WD40 repeat protein
MKTVRIFVSSPGDVGAEREKAREIFARLQTRFSGLLEIAPYWWEHEPMFVHADPQSQIEPPSKFDLFVCFLWSRLGSRLHPGIHRKPDGGAYESGTEYEVIDALEAWHRSGAPKGLIFCRKGAPPNPLSKPENERNKIIDQYKKLEQFLVWLKKQDDFFIRGTNGYTDLEDFETKFAILMEKTLEDFLSDAEIRSRRTPKSWKKGSPFRGLRYFDFEHAAIFFGRTRATEEVLNALRQQAADQRAFVLVFGGSGVGKSSLVRAGVLPLLVNPGVIEGVGLWRRAILRPSEVNEGDLFDALAAALMRPEALPEIGSDGTSVEKLASMLRNKPDGVGMLIKGALSQAAQKLQLEKRLKEQPRARLALVIDQLEELFTVERLADQREGFLRAIDALARSEYVWVLATLRSDFYSRCEESPILMELKKGAGQYHLEPPNEIQLGQMIRMPATAAGLEFEKNDKTGEQLEDFLRDAAVKNPAALPLLEFALEELYRQRDKETGLLKLDVYHDLGGVEGALAKRAEESFQSASEPAKQSFDFVFRQLVTVSTGEGEPAVRRRARKADVESIAGGHDLVERLTSDRLLVADRTEDGEIVIGLAHEAMLASWGRLADWVAHNRESLKIRAQVAIDTARWIENNRAEDYLYVAGLPIEKAKKMLTEHLLEKSEREFVEVSTARVGKIARRRARRLKQLAAVFGSLAVIAAGLGLLAVRNQRIANARAEQVRQSASRSEFATAVELLGQDNGNLALAHLARSVRLDTHNNVALLRLYALLGQRSWPLLLRTFPNPAGVRQIRLLPDGRRLLFECTASYDTTLETKNVSSLQIWDWKTNRILGPPNNQTRRSVDQVIIAPKADVVAVERSGKESDTGQLVLLLPLLSSDATPVAVERTTDVTKPTDIGNFAGTHFECFNDNGSLACVSGTWKEQGGNFACDALLAPANSSDLVGRLVRLLFWDKKPSEKELAALPKGNWVSLKNLPKSDSLLATRFDGSTLLLLFDNGALYKFDPRGDSVSRLGTIRPARMVQGKWVTVSANLKRATFAHQAPLLAISVSSEELGYGEDDPKIRIIELFNWQNGQIIGDLSQVMDEHTPNSIMLRTDNILSDSSSETGIYFTNDDQALVIASKKESGSSDKNEFTSAIWQFKRANAGFEVGESMPNGIVLDAARYGKRIDDTKLSLFDPARDLLCDPLNHESAVLSSDILNDQLFASGTENGFVRVWARLNAPFVGGTSGGHHSASKKDVQYDGALAESSAGAKLYEADEGAAESTIGQIERGDKKTELLFSRWGSIYGGHFDDTGSRLVAFGGMGQRGSTAGARHQGACVFDVNTGKLLSPLLAHPECTWALFDPTGKWIATFGNNYIQFWDATTFEDSGPRLVHNGVMWGAWNPVHPENFVSVSGDGAMKIWNLQKQIVIHEIAASPEANDQSDLRPKQLCYNSLVFEPNGTRFALRRGNISVEVRGDQKAEFQWAGTVAIGDAQNGSMLIDPVSVGFRNLRFSYDEATRLLDWPLPPSNPSADEVKLIASLAEAVAGTRIDDDSSIEVVGDRATPFQNVKSALNQTPAGGAISQLARSLMEQPGVKQLLSDDQPKLAENLAEGRAAYYMTEFCHWYFWPQGSDWESNVDSRDQLVRRIELRDFSQDENYREARRLSPKATDRMLRGITEDLRARSDPVAVFAAIQFGAHDSEHLSRARECLQRLRNSDQTIRASITKEMQNPVERREALAAFDQPDEEKQKGRQERDAILSEWEAKLKDN